MNKSNPKSIKDFGQPSHSGNRMHIQNQNQLQQQPQQQQSPFAVSGFDNTTANNHQVNQSKFNNYLPRARTPLVVPPMRYNYPNYSQRINTFPNQPNYSAQYMTRQMNSPPLGSLTSPFTAYPRQHLNNDNFWVTQSSAPSNIWNYSMNTQRSNNAGTMDSTMYPGYYYTYTHPYVYSYPNMYEYPYQKQTPFNELQQQQPQQPQQHQVNEPITSTSISSVSNCHPTSASSNSVQLLEQQKKELEVKLRPVIEKLLDDFQMVGKKDNNKRKIEYATEKKITVRSSTTPSPNSRESSNQIKLKEAVVLLSPLPSTSMGFTSTPQKSNDINNVDDVNGKTGKNQIIDYFNDSGSASSEEYDDSTKDKDYECDIDIQDDSFKPLKKRKVKTGKSHNRLIRCKKCDKWYHANGMWGHMKAKHETIKCHHCSTEFDNKNDLYAHILKCYGIQGKSD